MIIIGAAIEHWYHMDIELSLVLSKHAVIVWAAWVNRAGGWAHFVVKKNCAHKPAGSRWHSRWIGTSTSAYELHLCVVCALTDQVAVIETH